MRERRVQGGRAGWGGDKSSRRRSPACRFAPKCVTTFQETRESRSYSSGCMATPQALFTQEAEPRFTSESVGRLSRLGRIMPAAIPYGHAVASRIASVSVFIIPLAHRRNRNVIRPASILPAVFSCLLGAGFGQAAPSAPEKVTLIRAATLIDRVSAH